MVLHRGDRPLFTLALVLLLATALVGCSKGKTVKINNGTLTTEDGGGDAAEAKPTCKLTLASPHQGGVTGRLIFEPLTNPGNATSAIIWDAGNPQSEKKTIESITPRQIMVNPPGPNANFRVKYNNDSSEFSCELQVQVTQVTGGVGGTGMIIILPEIYQPPVNPPPIAVFGLDMIPACSNTRRPFPKRVAYDAFPGGHETASAQSRLRVLLSVEINGDVVFGRFYPKIQSFFDGGFTEAIPVAVLPPNDIPDIFVRVCLKEVPSDRPLVQTDFSCSSVFVERLIGTGKKVGSTNDYLTDTFAKYKRSELLAGKQVEFWNHRGNDDNWTCVNQYSPLVLDILGDGIKTSSASSNSVSFDLTASGREVKSGWVAGRDDGLLVRDLDHSGYIENGAELFGEYSGSRQGEKTYADGFKALKDLDSNGDDKFSPLDNAWSEVKLWFAHDFERVSVSSKPMLYPLDAIEIDGRKVSIDYINLNAAVIDPEARENGNSTKLISDFFLLDGGHSHSRNIVDIWFGTK